MKLSSMHSPCHNRPSDMFLLQSIQTIIVWIHKKMTYVCERLLWVLIINSAQNGLNFLSSMPFMYVIIPSQMAECLPSIIWNVWTWATVGGGYIVRSAPPPGCQRRCTLPLQVPRLRWLQLQARLSLQAAREQRNTASSPLPQAKTLHAESVDEGEGSGWMGESWWEWERKRSRCWSGSRVGSELKSAEREAAAPSTLILQLRPILKRK